MTAMLDQNYITQKLQDNLDPQSIVEVSSKDSDFKHVQLKIQSQQLKSLPLIQAHQRVLNIFKEELDQNLIHAISIQLI